MPGERRYVWIVLPDETAAIPCGLLEASMGRRWHFAYGRRYAARRDAISLSPDFPLDTALRGQWLEPLPGDALPAAIADVGPGRWGEYLLEKRLGRPAKPIEGLLATGAARIGALLFSEGPNRPPDLGIGDTLPLERLPDIADSVASLETADDIPQRYRFALERGPSVGGQRPKADFHDAQGQLWIAKFSSHKDHIPDHPRLEAFGLALAAACGIVVPEFKLVSVAERPVLLLKRFDRQADGRREHLLSARTLLSIPESRIDLDGSYPALAETLRRHSQDAADSHRWFDRMVFNILIGNTDDHPLNHLFGWDGQRLRLMPAFDLEACGGRDELRHQMRITPDSLIGDVPAALSVCAEFGLDRRRASARIGQLRQTIAGHWAPLAQRLQCSAAATAVIRRSLRHAD